MDKASHTISSKTTCLLLLIIAGVSFVVYFNALFNGFVADDIDLVVNNPWIRDIKYLTKIFTADVFGFGAPGFQIKTNYYRPLVHVIHMCSFCLLGLKPFLFHLVNILFHAGNSVLVFVITSRLLGEAHPRTSSPPSTLPVALSSPPFIAALLFATHPIHTEAVTFVSGLFDVSFAFFYLFSLWLYMRYKMGFRAGYVLSLASFFASTLCKEPALTLPLILIVYDYAFRKKEDSLLALVKRYIPYFIIAGIYMALRINALKSFTPDAPADITEMYYKGLSAWQYVINVLPLFVQYINDLFFPFNLNFWHTFRPIETLLNAKGMLSIAVTVAYLLAVLFAWRRNRTMFFSLLFIIGPLLPAFYIKALSGMPYGERYLYLPSFGFVVLLAIFFEVLNKKMTRYSIAAMLIVVSVIGLYSFRTITRNFVWRDDFTLLTDTIKKSPDAEVPRIRLAQVLINMNRNGEAIAQYRKALELNPNDFLVHQYIADRYMIAGMPEQAQKEYREVMNLNPNFFLNYNNLLNQSKEAIDLQKKQLIKETIEQEVRLQPENAIYREVLGLAYGQTGSYDKAIEQFKIALQLAPSNPVFRKNLDIALGRLHVPGF
ncbi:MAG: tetratricopeptide repeat protein [Nitrospirae bacterium]|nr:tetratricopeptide repeat protein [Nitrospirota bacterium]